MNNFRNTSRQRGAALVIGLILLAVITLLAVVGMNISNSELASATSEQVRLRAFQAAETGVEYAMQKDEPNGNDVYDTGTNCHDVKITPVTAIAGSQLNAASGLPTDHYTSRISFMAAGPPPDGYSGNKFITLHYVVESNGSSSRNAIAKHQQGTYRIGKSNGADSIDDLGSPCSIPIVGGFTGP